MFRGRSLLKFDDKGRISIPARHREVVNANHGGRLVISQGFFPELPHLLVVPFDVWLEFEEAFGGSGVFDTSLERFQARLRTMGGCEEARLDEHGRILVPAAYRAYAGLGPEVACVGMGRYLSIWKPAGLDAAMAGAEKNLAEVRKQLAVREERPENHTGR
jgi:MraZ protein